MLSPPSPLNLRQNKIRAQSLQSASCPLTIISHISWRSGFTSNPPLLLPIPPLKRMARRLPPSVEGNLFAHPALSLPLLVAWLAASIAILASLCASCYRKPATKPSPSSPAAQSNSSVRSKAEQTEVQEQEREQDGEDYIPPLSDERITELDAAIHGPIYPTANLPAGSKSKRRLSVSLSTGIRDGLKEGLSRIKTKKEAAPRGRGGGEESLWKKTIILGGKCKMASGDGEERNGTELNRDVSRNTSFASAEEVVRFSTSG